MPAAPANELWRKIVIIHNHTKAHLIYCEESGIEHKTFIQPRNELCNALEHIVRSKARELGISRGDEDLEGYWIANLDKALGHEFRAFFDVCDWLGMILREKIVKELEPYSPEVIEKAWPNYFTAVRPQLERIPQKIAEVRARKDISGDVLSEVETYNRILLELKDFTSDMYSHRPTLEAFSKSRERAKLWVAIGGIFTAAVGWGLKALWDWSHKS
jgi:hypothetical protein